MHSDPTGVGRRGPVPAAAAAGTGPSSSHSHTPPADGRSAGDLSAARAALVAGRPPGRRLDSEALRRALVELHDFWLSATAADLGIVPDSGFALVAVGGLGRREMLPHSDLDLILLHDDMSPKAVQAVADRLWYPLWDAHLKLDHSVRTVPQALQVAAQDLTAALGMLEARHIAGDTELSHLLIGGVRRQWRVDIRKRFDDLVDMTESRWQRSGQIAHRAEPDLKNGRGGLRDIQLLNALAIAQVTDGMPGLGSETPGGGLAAAHRRLLDVRTELHRVAGRPRDQMRAQDADEIAATLRIGDRFDLARVLTESSRTVGYSVEVGLRTAGNSLPRRGLSRLRKVPARRPLDEGVVEHGGEVALARDAHPRRDAGLVTRVAAASVRARLPIAAGTLARLSDTAPELREPWPRQVLDDFLVLLASGRTAVDVIEALDRTGLWGRLLPEWGAVRDLPPRDALHTWTVDRHLVETTVHAAEFTTRVSRPDLLLLGALLHDIGKGRNGDHSVVGAELVTRIGRRMGLWPSDIALLSAVVRHHLLLPHTATRRDLADPATVAAVVDAIGGDTVVLELLFALAEADSKATGPGVWGEWKASLIGELVRRCRLMMAGESLPTPDPIDPELLRLAEAGELHVAIEPNPGDRAYTVTVVAPDERGVLSDSAGVLALHGLRVLSASIGSHHGSAVDTFVVVPRFGEPPIAALLRQELLRARAGDLDLTADLDAKDRAARASMMPERAEHAVPGSRAQAPPRLIWFDGTEPGRVVLEVRSEDRLGLLCRLAAVFEEHGADVKWAKVMTVGATVVDTFCIEILGVSTVSLRERLERALLSVLPAPEPKKPTEGA